MKYDMIGVLILTVLVTTTHCQNLALSATEKNKIEKGLAAGQAMANAFEKEEFGKSLQALGNNIAPFLRVVGPLAVLAIAFIHTTDSPQLIEMRKSFRNVNVKLDKITSEFKEIKRAIDWSTVVNSYGVYERKIRTAAKNLNQIYVNKGQARFSEKWNFIIQYENDFGESLDKLYDGIVFNNYVFTTNIMLTAVERLKYHKRKFEHFAIGLAKVLVQGIKVKVTYYALKKWANDHLIWKWRLQMIWFGELVRMFSDDIKYRYWYPQMKTEANNLVREHRGLGNKDLLLKIYNFMVEKYDWRYWFVAVYDDMRGYDRHTISAGPCGGVTFLHNEGKNVIISSQDKEESKFSKTNAESIIKSVEEDIEACAKDTREAKSRALTLVDKAQEKAKNANKGTGSSCVPYALTMAVKFHSNLWYKSDKSQRAYKSINRDKYCCWGEGILGKQCRSMWWGYSLILFG